MDYYETDDLVLFNRCRELKLMDYITEITNTHQDNKEAFYFLLKNSFFGKLENFIKVMNYCFSQKYIDKNSDDFQMYVANILFKMNDEEVMGLEKYKGSGISNLDNVEVFIWACKNILNPEVLRTFTSDFNKITETLFHQIFRSFINIPKEYIDKLFLIFDNAKFDYLTPGLPSLVGYAIRYGNSYILHELLKKSKFDLNTNEIHQICHLIIILRLQILKFYENKYGGIFTHIYNNDNVIKHFFNENMITINQENQESFVNNHIIDYFIRNFGEQEYKMISTYKYRSHLVKPYNYIKNYLAIFFIMIQNGLDVKRTCEGKTLLENYLRGCKPIEINQWFLHIKFIELFNYSYFI
jgi:hypothetical protein